MIYHITTKNDWQKAQELGFYEAISLETEGFIHASEKNQVAPSANLFFQGQENLIVLGIEEALLESAIIYENTVGGTELFPHIYGKINLNAVVKIIQLEKNTEGQFVF
jgi:uncharacterized protein (DUF952 family)